jgi:hypothetical protein
MYGVMESPSGLTLGFTVTILNTPSLLQSHLAMGGNYATLPTMFIRITKSALLRAASFVLSISSILSGTSFPIYD